ncbi:structure-specific endonuclease subunit SLX1 [Tanacetum coccineum]
MTRLLLSTTFRSVKPKSPPSATKLPISSPSISVKANNCLKQHNGELKGGAKASQAGRPWICACIIHGFETKSEACKFEYKWKNVSSKMSRKKKPQEEGGLHLLQHRNAALEKVKGLIDCRDLEFDWKLEHS